MIGSQLCFLSICVPHSHKNLMHLIHKLLWVLWSLSTCQPCYALMGSPSQHSVDWPGSNVLGLHSDGLCHLGKRCLHLRISQPNRVNWHSSLFSWSLGWNPIVPRSYSSSHLTSVPPSINSLKKIRIDVRHAHITMKLNIRKATIRSEEGNFLTHHEVSNSG